MTETGSIANWRSAGACLSADPDLFFPVSTTGPADKQVARAKLICAGCVVRQECLDFALAHDQTHGIWGGTTAEERQRARRRQRRAVAAAAKRTAHAAFQRRPMAGTRLSTLVLLWLVRMSRSSYVMPSGYWSRVASSSRR